MRPSVRRLEEQYQDRVDFHILSVDRPSSQPLVQQYQAHAIPLIILLDADGHLVRRLSGYQTEEQLVAAIEALLATTVTPAP
ncbi:MAG: hypothetical protein Kow00106_00850 [Anaerolineae bacterium]